MKRGYLIAVLLLFSISIAGLISAATLVSPVRWGNYSTVLNFSCRADIDHVLNASLYYSATGGSAVNGTGLLLSVITNTSANQSVFENATVNITGLTEGAIYNFSCILRNGTTAGFNPNATTYSTGISNVTIDRTVPNVSSTLVSTVNYGNYTGTLVLNVSANDLLAGISFVYFNITYSNGTQVNYSQAVASGGYYSTSLDTTTFLEGSYNLTVYVNDSSNNINASTVLFLTFDGVAPAGGMSCSPSSVYRGEAVTCTCSGSDAGTGVASTTGSTSPSTPETGEFTEHCVITDYAGNSVTVAGTYTVKLRPSSTRSVPLNTATTQTGNKTNESITTSEINPLTGGEQQKGMLLGVSYWVWITFTLIALAVLLGWKFLPRVKKKRK